MVKQINNHSYNKGSCGLDSIRGCFNYLIGVVDISEFGNMRIKEYFLEIIFYSVVFLEIIFYSVVFFVIAGWFGYLISLVTAQGVTQ